MKIDRIDGIVAH